ncbi:MAG: hypothetical protein ABI383_14770 [Acidobacteriaceae bacterium]
MKNLGNDSCLSPFLWIMGKVVVIPARPYPKIHQKREPPPAPIGEHPYLDGQRLLVEAIKYLVREDAEQNREAIGLLSQHFRTKFRMSDRPLAPNPRLVRD